MKRSELIEAMQSCGFHPSKNLGQNFLTDENILEYIVTRANVQSTDRVLEVGPGFGALTRHLLATNAEVFAIEFDYRLAQWLHLNLGSQPNFHLTEADAVKVNYAELLGTRPYKIVANLPYSISTPFIMTMLMLENPPQSMTLMLQKEVAERFAATPRSKAYGAVSICVQHAYEATVDRIVPPQLFMPVPDVDSAILTLEARPEFPSLEARTQLNKLVKMAFLQRRKKMAGVLGSVFGRECVETALSELNIRVDARPEMLRYDEFKLLANKLLTPVK